MKIVYCLNNLYQLGGIVKIISQKVNTLSEIENNQIFIVVLDRKKNNLFYISNKIKVIDLRIDFSQLDNLKGIKYFITLIKLHWITRKCLKSTLNLIKPDIVISVGQWEKNIIPFIYGKWKTIREFHFSRFYRNHLKYSKKKYIDKIFKFLISHFEILILKKYDKIVILTNEDKQLNWKKWENICVIPNPIPIDIVITSKHENNEIISIGRLTEQKNYKSLINIFSKISPIFPDWSLKIYGDGPERENLLNQIFNLNLQDKIFLEGECLNINKIYERGSIFALTSIYEGMPLVILEAMKAGLPVISYDCPCGPKDLINNGKDGFLIPTSNELQFIEKLTFLIKEKDLRERMSVQASIKMKSYSIDVIINKWQKLFNLLIKNHDYD